MLDRLSPYARWFTLIGGFLFGVVGAVWSFTFIDQGNDAQKQLTDRKAALTRETQSLNDIASNYFVANQQGDLIFILGAQPGARQDIVSLIHRANLLDRATPVRNMIGALAIAGQLDYRQTYDAYAKLNDQARAELTFANFSQVKEREKEIIQQGQARVPVLLDMQASLDRAIADNESARRKNRMLGLGSSILGSFLLLLANLIEKRGREG